MLKIHCFEKYIKTINEIQTCLAIFMNAIMNTKHIIIYLKSSIFTQTKI